MAKVIEQMVTDKYALYNADSCEALTDIQNDSIHLSIYSPPFATLNGVSLYRYSSSIRDLSNASSYDDFFEHYGYIINELYRVTMAGRISAVHCTDILNSNSGKDDFNHFSGDIINAHKKAGWLYKGIHYIKREALMIRNKTMVRHLHHKTLCDDSVYTAPAMPDFLILFQKRGVNTIPVRHENGLTSYAGAKQVPYDLHEYRNYNGNQIENKYSQWIWRQYAQFVWDDIRHDWTVDYEGGRDEEDERHVHPLQLDVIERCVQLYSNAGEVVLSPFAGVGSEVYGAVINGRKGIGIELKASYYKQMVKNMAHAENYVREPESLDLFSQQVPQ